MSKKENSAFVYPASHQLHYILENQRQEYLTQNSNEMASTPAPTPVPTPLPTPPDCSLESREIPQHNNLRR